MKKGGGLEGNIKAVSAQGYLSPRKRIQMRRKIKIKQKL